MLIRILEEALRNRPRRAAVAVFAVTVGTALAAALLGISLDIRGKMARELRNYGANILVVPKSAAVRLEIGGVSLSPPSARAGIDENELVKLKSIFWKNNIVGFAPFLSTVVQANGRRAVLTGTWFAKKLALSAGEPKGSSGGQGATAPEGFTTGVRTISPWWQVQGDWARDENPLEAMIGATLARQLGLQVGDTFSVRSAQRERLLRLTGLVSTGGSEEEQIFVALQTVQELLGLNSGADTVTVSALVQPDDTLRPDLRGLDPAEMTPEQYATWYCSPIMGAVVKQISEALPGTEVKPIRQIAEAEGAFLGRIGFLMALVTVFALAASGLTVMTAMTAAVLERRTEIGLMKAIGANNRQVALIFLSEAGLVGLIGGLLGYVLGLALAAFIGRQVFSAAISPQLVVLPVAFCLSLIITLAGSALPVRRAVRIDPVLLLRGR